MMRNYIAAALRNLVRNRLYAAINLIGLAAGLAAALLIVLFVRDEFSYDTWIPGHERVYAVHSTSIETSQTTHYAIAPVITARLLAQDFPEQVSAVARFLEGSGWSVRRGDIEYLETVAWADPSLFQVLPLPAIAGDLATALQDADGIVLTRSMARKYFGTDTPIGETLELKRQTVMRVTAVLEDLPSNTHLTNAQFNLGIFASGRNAASPLAHADSGKGVQPTGLLPLLFTYVRLAPGASADALKGALRSFEQQHPRFQTPSVSYLHDLMPLADLHLHAPPDPRRQKGSADTAYGALSIALLIVAIASINFVNLTTARATRRAVEVGVRKASGAERRNLIVQFIGESMIYALLGMGLAVTFARLLLPAFNGFLQRTVVFDWLRDPHLLGALFLAAASIGFLAGAYPALVLSRFSPAVVLKGSLTGMRGGRGRLILVALQFMVLIVLALVATTIYRQTNYAMNEALRFDKDQMLVVRTRGNDATLPCDSTFAEAVRAPPGVRGAACANSRPVPVGGWMNTSVTGPDGATTAAAQVLTGFGYFELLGIQPIAGRTFSRNFAGDAGSADGSAPPAVVINEAMSRALGFASPQRAVGQTVHWHPYGDFGTAALAAVYAKTAPPAGPSQVIGVVPDFALASARQAPEPGIFWVSPVGNTVLNIKLQSNQVPETLAAIDQLWKRLGLSSPIDRRFLDQEIENIYRDVTLLSEAMAAFAAVAVFAYFIVRHWLEGFAVRIDIGLWTFPVASLMALLIAALTVGGHALLVTRAHPVTALRYE